MYHVTLISPVLSRSHLLAVQTANCFLSVVLEVAVRWLGHEKNIWLTDRLRQWVIVGSQNGFYYWQVDCRKIRRHDYEHSSDHVVRDVTRDDVTDDGTSRRFVGRHRTTNRENETWVLPAVRHFMLKNMSTNDYHWWWIFENEYRYVMGCR